MKKSRVLVTGADGFIGSHLTEGLLERGYYVRALSYYNSFNYWGWLEDIPRDSKLEIITGDIRDPHFIRNAITDVDIVFHLAALIGIPYSYHSPSSYIDTNIIGTLNVCQAAKEFGGIRVLNTSTSEVYGTAQYVPIDEKHPKQPQSPYAASKIGADALAMSFFSVYNLPVTNVRPFNTYGPRQSARAIIPTIITQIAQGLKEVTLGDLSPTRDFNYVKDIVSAFISISESNNTIGLELNVATNFEVSVESTLKLITEIMQTEVNVIQDDQRLRPPGSEVFRLCGDNSRIKELTGWKPRYTLEEGLKETIIWFNDPNNLKKYKAAIYNV